MIRAADFAEAQNLVTAINRLDGYLRLKLHGSGHAQLPVIDGNSTSNVAIDKEVALAAFELQRKAWISRRAAFVRRANQLGIIMEDKANG